MVADLIESESLFFSDKDLGDEVLEMRTESGRLHGYINRNLLLRENCILLTLSIICLSSYPSKGGAAVAKIYNKTPADHISHLSS
jgi:hypothetical protein